MAHDNVMLDTPEVRTKLDAEIAIYQSIERAQALSHRIEVRGAMLLRLLSERREAVSTEMVAELKQIADRLDAIRVGLETP